MSMQWWCPRAQEHWLLAISLPFHLMLSTPQIFTFDSICSPSPSSSPYRACPLIPPTRFLSLDTVNVVHIYSFAFLERQVGFQCLFHLWCGISLVAYSWDCVPPIRSLRQCHHHSTHSWWLLCIHVNCCVLHVASSRSQSSPISWSSLLVFNVQTMLLSTLGSSWSNAWHLAHGIPTSPPSLRVG